MLKGDILVTVSSLKNEELKAVLRIKKIILKKEPGAFSNKQFGENCRAFNFFAISLIMLIPFLNDVDIQLIL